MPILQRPMDTDDVAPAERAGYWSEWLDRLFQGLSNDLYGDTRFDGRATTLHAGDVVLTRLEANRHLVTRSAAQVRASDVGYLKIVAPWAGCAGVGQRGREAWVTPDQWSIYDTTEAYAVANPVRVEHLVVMVPKARLAERGLAIESLMARRLGGSGGVARMALETMRSAWRELPGMSDVAAEGIGDAIVQLVHLSMLDLAGVATAATQKEQLRDRIKRHVTEHLGDTGLSVDGIATALGTSRRNLYNAFADEPDGVAGYLLARRVDACRHALADAQQAHRSITDVAIAHGFANMAHFSRVFRARVGVPPSDFRRGAAT